MLAVPADAAGQCAATGATWVVDAEVTLYRPVVRQGELSPRQNSQPRSKLSVSRADEGRVERRERRSVKSREEMW